MSAIDKIEHIVVLIMENHSFDQMLGCLNAVYPELDGVSSANKNSDDEGGEFFQIPGTERQMLLDPHHEVPHVARQLQGGNGGFVMDFVESQRNEKTPRNPPPTARQYIMSYYPLDSLPALHGLGRIFTVCDRWHSSLPGPTWPNRFFALSGTCLGRVDMPDDGVSGKDIPGFFQQTQDTIFDRLTEAGIHWNVYFHDIPQSWTMKHMRAPHNAARYFYMRQFYEDARGAERDFPQFSLIEPDYMGTEENDDHPPHDIMKAEKLIADVYNALRGNEELWAKTLLVIFYDEHGGFYDHVKPPTGVIAPDDHIAKDPKGAWTFDFKQLGVRVPAILASPWVGARVEKTLFDHTSLLKFVQDKWHLRPLESKRIAAATSIAVALTEQAPRTDTISRIVMTPDQLVPPDMELEEQAFGLVTEHHKALKHFANFLPSALWEDATKAGDEAAPRIYSALARAATGALDWLRGRCETGMATLYGTKGYNVAIARPDRLASESATARNEVVRFLSTQKPRAVEGLANRINDENRPVQERHHALRTLSAMTGRPFHRHDTTFARRWIARHAPSAGQTPQRNDR